MATARLSRPWLFSVAAPRPASTSTGMSRTTAALLPRETRRMNSSGALSDAQRRAARNSRQLLKKVTQGLESQRLPGFLLPATLVTPPLSRFPRSPKEFTHFSYLIAKNKLFNWWTAIAFKFMSMSTVTSRPKFKIRRGAIVVTAKALHRQFAEAVAAGDKEMLRQICTPELYQQYAGVIDARPKNQRTEWELVEYTNTLRYPRIADHKTTMMPHPSGKESLLRQAVVSISSKQRLCRYEVGRDGVEKSIPGSERIRDVIEHLVLMSEVDKATSETGPWKVWGTVGETTYEEYLEEMEDVVKANSG